MLIYGLKIKVSELTDSMRGYILNELKETMLVMPYDQKPLYNMFEEFCKNHKEYNSSSAAEEWFTDMDWYGYTPAWILCEIINKKENLALSCESDVFGCPMACPWDFDKNMKALTEEEFKKIIDKYMASMKIAEDDFPSVCEWDTTML